MSAAWTVAAPVMASAAAARRVFMSFLPNQTIYPLPEAIEALAQRALSQLNAVSRAKTSICTYLRLGAIARLYKREFFIDA